MLFFALPVRELQEAYDRDGERSGARALELLRRMQLGEAWPGVRVYPRTELFDAEVANLQAQVRALIGLGTAE